MEVDLFFLGLVVLFVLRRFGSSCSLVLTGVPLLFDLICDFLGVGGIYARP